MKRTIQVEQRHIADGVPSESDACPVALALLDGGVTDALVGYAEISFRDGEQWYLCNRVPSEISEFIELFDSGETVTPMEIEIEADRVTLVGTKR